MTMIKVAQKNNNGGGERDKSNETSFAQTQKHEKRCYCCGLGTKVLNIYNIRDTIARDQQFDRTQNVHSNQQQPVGKNDEKTLESETDVSVSITKTSVWRRLQISLHGSKQVKK